MILFATPEHELGDPLGELPRGVHDEVDCGRDGRVEGRVAHELPARLVDKRKSHVDDDEVDVRKIRRRPVHVPGFYASIGWGPKGAPLRPPIRLIPSFITFS
jgi:hypothetical protein